MIGEYISEVEGLEHSSSSQSFPQSEAAIVSDFNNFIGSFIRVFSILSGLFCFNNDILSNSASLFTSFVVLSLVVSLYQCTFVLFYFFQINYLLNV